MATGTDIHVAEAQEFVEGGGFVVHRPFPVRGLSYFDPFLLIDEMGPVVYGAHEAIGAPDHPHRGFETVTYIIEGAMEHEDSHGHRGSIRTGDVQWMTAGAGVIHSEMPAEEIMERGGRMHGFQIWVNLPRELKMAQPRYQEYTSAELPVIDSGSHWVRVIAGTFEGRRSPIETTVPTTMLHVKLRPNGGAPVAIAPGSNAIVYAIDGEGMANGVSLSRRDVALLTDAPATIELAATASEFEALVLAGVPLREPVARYGPFVMNTVGELETAVADYQSGRFGEIARER